MLPKSREELVHQISQFVRTDLIQNPDYDLKAD